jgi:hypothetical protein
MTEASDKQWDSYLPNNQESLQRFLDEGRSALRVIAGDIPGSDVVATEEGTQDGGDFIWRKLVIHRRSLEQKTPAVWLQKPGKPNSVLIWVDANGKSSIHNGGKLAEPARKALEAGGAILAIDAIGTGEWSNHNSLAVDKKFAGYTYGYNSTLASQRVQDILDAVVHARHSSDNVYLAGFGAAGPWVLLARGLCGDAVSRCAADANRFNFRSITTTDDPMMLPGALKYGGLDGLAALSAPSPLLIHNSEGSNLGHWLKAAYVAGGHPDHLELKTEPQTQAEVIAWLLR